MRLNICRDRFRVRLRACRPTLDGGWACPEPLRRSVRTNSPKCKSCRSGWQRLGRTDRTIVSFAALIMVVLLVPRRLDLDRAPAPLSAGICFSALVLRALIAAFAAIFVLLYLPTTPLFTMVSHWCLDAVIGRRRSPCY